MMKAYLLLILCVMPFSHEQCCTKFVTNTKKCSECPAGTHLFRNNCILDVQNCETYADGFDCNKCKSGFTITNGQCKSSTTAPPTQTPSTPGIVDTYLDVTMNDNLLILSDYSRSVQQQLETAEVLFGFVRKYENGTEHTIVQFQTKSKKWYRSMAKFQKDIPFAFTLISIVQLKEKPVKNTNNPTPPDNTSNPPTNTTTPPTNPPTNNTTNPPSNIIQNSQFGLNKVNYKFLTFDDRKNDDGFKAVDVLSKQVNADTLGKTPVVLGTYVQVKGLNAEYIVYYESTDKKSIYQLKAVYQILRKKVFILSMTRTNLR